MRILITILSFLIFLLSLESQAQANFPFRNIDTIKSSLGFTKYYQMGNTGRSLKIAILDKGFAGYESEIGRTLPAETVYQPGPVAAPPELKTEHGLRMAQILVSLMTDSLKARQWMPQITLYNVFGFSNLKSAIDDMIAKKVDLVLYSEVWEYGGNSDGAGFINAEVNRATQAGIIWINAAGNFNQTTFNSKIETLQDDWVKLPDQNNALNIRCDGGSQTKACPVKIVLSWNDFKNDSQLGTRQDLDLALTDDMLNIIESSALRQSEDVNESRPGYSKYPREIIATNLKPGQYFLRIKNRSKNFTDKSQFRITIDGDSITMPSHSINESLLNPADNLNVITVGASDSDRSSQSQKINKPDLLTNSSILFTDGNEYRGSSNSAAIVAAGLAILKTQNPSLSRAQLISQVQKAYAWDQAGLSLQQLVFSYTGPGCFWEAQLPQMPDYIQRQINHGGVLVQTTNGIRLMTPFDPILLNSNLRRSQMNDMIVATPNGIELYSRFSYIPNGAIEIFQRPLEAGLCQPPSQNKGKRFLLP